MQLLRLMQLSPLISPAKKLTAELFSHVPYGVPDNFFKYSNAYVRQSIDVKARSGTGFVFSQFLQLMLIG